MKKLVALFLVLTLALSLAACGSKDDTEAPSDTKTEPTNAPTTESTEAPTTEATQPEQPTVEVPGAPYFYNDNVDGRWSVEAITAVPKEVYFENGQLIVHCFVVNGFSTTATNVGVTYLEVKDKNGTLIASANFNQQNLVIGPLSYVEHTFAFGSDTVAATDVDMSSLSVSCQFTATH